jgi:hypothetical protein
MGHGNLKDDAIIARLTTRCSSAFALIASCWGGPLRANHGRDLIRLPARRRSIATLPSLVPAMPVWSLPLNNELTAPPAYDETTVFFRLKATASPPTRSCRAPEWLAPCARRCSPRSATALLFLIDAEKLSALKATDGPIAWQLPFTEKLAVRPVWDNGWLVLATEPGEILALRATDGHLVWRRTLESRAPCAAGARRRSRLHPEPSENGVVALRVDTGEVVWERRLGGSPNEIPRARGADLLGREGQLLLLSDGEGRPASTGGGAPAAMRSGCRSPTRTASTSSPWTTCCAPLDLKSGVQHWMRPLTLRPAWWTGADRRDRRRRRPDGVSALVRPEGWEAGRAT